MSVWWISVTSPCWVRNHCSYISKMKMFSILYQPNSFILWMGERAGKPLTQRKEQGVKDFCLFETTWTQGQSVRKDIWISYFLMFLPSFSYLLFKSTHTPSTHSSLWEELHILTAYCMQTHFWFLLLHFGHWLATLLPYSLNIISWRLFTNTVGNLCPIWCGCCGISFIHKEPFQTSSNS